MNTLSFNLELSLKVIPVKTLPFPYARLAFSALYETSKEGLNFILILWLKEQNFMSDLKKSFVSISLQQLPTWKKQTSIESK